MSEIVELLPPKEQGESLLEIKQTLEHIGLEARGFRAGTRTSAAVQKLSTPFIASYGDHFVAVDTVDQGTLRLFDGGGSRRYVRMEQFLRRWDGNVMCVAIGQNKDPLPRYAYTKSATQPCAQFESLYADFGELSTKDTPEIECTFSVLNAGGDALTVHEVKSDCSCVTTAVPDSPIAPGATGKIKVIQNITAQNGVFEKRLLIHTNDPARPVVEAFIAGNTTGELTISHSHVKFFYAVRGREYNEQIYIRFTGKHALEIPGISTTIPEVTATGCRYEDAVKRDDVKALFGKLPEWMPEEQYMENGNSYVVTVTVQCPEDAPNRLFGNVDIETNLEETPVISIPVVAEVVDAVECRPRMLFLSDAPDNGDRSVLISLVSRISSSWSIRSLQCVGFRMDWEARKDESGNDCGIRFYGQPVFDGTPKPQVHLVVTSKDDDSGDVSIVLPVWHKEGIQNHIDSKDLTATETDDVRSIVEQ